VSPDSDAKEVEAADKANATGGAPLIPDDRDARPGSHPGSKLMTTERAKTGEDNLRRHGERAMPHK
jgi:hypothetical protein